MNRTTTPRPRALQRSALCAGLLTLWACTPPLPAQPAYQPTPADLAHAAHHEFDGRYVGTGNIAPGASCTQLVANWGATMTVTGPTFALTPFFNGGINPVYYGNVSPGGVLTTRKNVFVGRIADGRFVGEYQLSATCRGRYVMDRQPPPPNTP